jgi:NADH-quinone oxidoreductase subunit J
MAYVLYIASAMGALALYLMLPAGRRRAPVVGGLLGLVVLGGLGLCLVALVNPADRPSLYYYIFTAISFIAAVRVICQRRPVYSALYFVLVVLSVAGMFLVLEAEFMAFATIIIYAGAILVTYLFVIMLASLPASSADEQQIPLYDRLAREPLAASALGFVLLAVLSQAIFVPAAPIERRADVSDLKLAVDLLPGRVVKVLDEHHLLTPDQTVASMSLVGPAPRYQQLKVELTDQTTLSFPLDHQTGDRWVLRDAISNAVGNIDRVGVNLFESHVLGIELAGIVLLVSMVGAVVMARKRVIAQTTAPAEPQT